MTKKTTNNKKSVIKKTVATVSITPSRVIIHDVPDLELDVDRVSPIELGKSDVSN